MRESRFMVLALAMLTAGLTGCIGSDSGTRNVPSATDRAPGSPSFADGAPAPTSLQVRDCYEHAGFFPVPASAYEGKLPDGFELASYQEEPSGHSAVLEVFAAACEHPNGTTVSWAETVLRVDPPGAWENEDAIGHGLILSWVTTSEHRARVNDAWGLGDVVQTGDVSLKEAQTPAVRQGTLHVSTGETTFRLETLAGGPPDQAAGIEFRVFGLGDDGTVTGAKDVTWTQNTAAFGSGVLSGSAHAALGGVVPAEIGTGAHFWGFDETETFVELPPKEEG